MANDSGIERAEYPRFEHRLRARWEELHREIRATLLRTSEEGYLQVRGDIHDEGDAALADLVVDINNAEVSRDVRETREINSALQRIANGTYGVCERCQQPIARARLDATPTARLCIACQSLAERTEQSQPTPKI